MFTPPSLTSVCTKDCFGKIALTTTGKDYAVSQVIKVMYEERFTRYKGYLVGTKCKPMQIPKTQCAERIKA